MGKASADRVSVHVLSLGVESPILDEIRNSPVGQKYSFRQVNSTEDIEHSVENSQSKIVLLDLDKNGWSSLSILEANPQNPNLVTVVAVVKPETLEIHRAARYFKVEEFLVRPLQPALVEMALERASERQRLKADNQRLRQSVDWYRLELAHHLFRNPLAMDHSPQTEKIPSSMLEAIERSKREKRWKEALHGDDSLDQLLEKIIALVTQEWKVARASLMLFDRSRGHLEIKRAVGLDEDIVRKTRVPMGQGPSGYVAETRKPLLVKDPLDYIVSNWPMRNENPSFASIPLLCAGELIGVLNVTGKKSGKEFTEEEMDYLTTFGSIVSDALDRVLLFEGLREGYLATIKSLAIAIERKDPYTSGHSLRVCEYSLAIAQEMGVSQKDLETLDSAAVLHDIGKIGIPLSIVHKPGPLTPEENHILRQHPKIGAELLGCLRHFNHERDVVRYHHEWWDGSGYPEGRKGDQLSLCTRIVAVADAYDAMTTHRSYRSAIQQELACREVQAQSGTQFDPDVVKAFTRLWHSTSGTLSPFDQQTTPRSEKAG